VTPTRSAALLAAARQRRELFARGHPDDAIPVGIILDDRLPGDARPHALMNGPHFA
jgi:hypothetical protein